MSVAKEDKPTQAKAPAKGKNPDEALIKLSIQAKQAGFRRAGRAWSTEPEIVDAADFSEEQLAQLKAEPMLIVQAVE